MAASLRAAGQELDPGRAACPAATTAPTAADRLGHMERAWQSTPPPPDCDWFKEHRMRLLDIFKKEPSLHNLYERFEFIVSGILLVIISIIIVYSLVLVVITLAADFRADIYFAQNGALKDTFGLILGLLILVEFNHSIALSMRRHSGVLQVRIIVLIAIIVIARKLILLDYANTAVNTLLGLGGLALSLGALYWLLTDVELRRRPSAPTE
jgi:uncharacterized membrane protein (DUF373 family)